MKVTTNVPEGKRIEIPPDLWIHIMGGSDAVMKRVHEFFEREANETEGN